MVALDLDGTALTTDRHFSPRTREAFRRAMEQGVHIVISTGRVWHSLPEEMFDIEGLEYVITSNGATVTEMATGEHIYENRLDPDAVEKIIATIRPWFGRDGFSVDAFVDGKAYMEEREYRDMEQNGSDYRTQDYVLSTRNPIEGLLDFMEENRDRMENISLIFRHKEEQDAMYRKLEKIHNITMVSSFTNKFEIGGPTTSKADALVMLMQRLGVGRSELMACGDSINDLAMIRLAEVGVAMGNAVLGIQSAANYITDTNDEDGVAKAIEKFVLD
jgi:Cof subfamily protein (haloacid dehalogenase superfamily)